MKKLGFPLLLLCIFFTLSCSHTPRSQDKELFTTSEEISAAIKSSKEVPREDSPRDIICQKSSPCKVAYSTFLPNQDNDGDWDYTVFMKKENMFYKYVFGNKQFQAIESIPPKKDTPESFSFNENRANDFAIWSEDIKGNCTANINWNELVTFKTICRNMKFKNSSSDENKHLNACYTHVYGDNVYINCRKIRKNIEE